MRVLGTDLHLKHVGVSGAKLYMKMLQSLTELFLEDRLIWSQIPTWGCRSPRSHLYFENVGVPAVIHIVTLRIKVPGDKLHFEDVGVPDAKLYSERLKN